jgi:hypothetical protein
MPFNVNEFKAQLVGGGARPTLFQVQITNPIDPIADFKVPFMVKTAALPESTLGSYAVPYFGRFVKYAGDRIFGDWTVAVINDEDFAIRNAMESWTNAINSHDSNTRALPQTYKSNAIITQYSKDGRALRTYVFEGLYPTSVQEIQMDWGDTDRIEEYSVTFQYDLWRVEGSTGISTT